MSIRVIQLRNGAERRLGFVEEPRIRLFKSIHTAYDLFNAAFDSHRGVADLIEDALGDERLDYDPISLGQSDWKILPAIDHPEPARCVVTGTGLTHLGSAKSRSSMHEGGPKDSVPVESDSMKMFRWGVES